jgi:hypothetical protein
VRAQSIAQKRKALPLDRGEARAGGDLRRARSIEVDREKLMKR